MRKLIFRVSLVLFSIVACTSFISAQKIIKGYEGNSKPANEVITIRYDGNNIAIKFWIFKVDGKVTSDFNSLLFTYNSPPKGTINLQLLPGNHELEIQRSVSDKLQVLTFTGEAGKEYLLLSEKELLKIVEKTGDKINGVDFTIRDIPFYSEVPESEPHALLIEDGKAKGNNSNGVTALLRIDGLPGSNLMTGWVAHYMFNNRFKFDFSVRLTPGEHTFDFYGLLDRLST
jgi:hypothetical protein